MVIDFTRLGGSEKNHFIYTTASMFYYFPCLHYQSQISLLIIFSVEVESYNRVLRLNFQLVNLKETSSKFQGASYNQKNVVNKNTSKWFYLEFTILINSYITGFQILQSNKNCELRNMYTMDSFEVISLIVQYSLVWHLTGWNTIEVI